MKFWTVIIIFVCAVVLSRCSSDSTESEAIKRGQHMADSIQSLMHAPATALTMKTTSVVPQIPTGPIVVKISHGIGYENGRVVIRGKTNLPRGAVIEIDLLGLTTAQRSSREISLTDSSFIACFDSCSDGNYYSYLISIDADSQPPVVRQYGFAFDTANGFGKSGIDSLFDSNTNPKIGGVGLLGSKSYELSNERIVRATPNYTKMKLKVAGLIQEGQSLLALGVRESKQALARVTITEEEFSELSPQERDKIVKLTPGLEAIQTRLHQWNSQIANLPLDFLSLKSSADDLMFNMALEKRGDASDYGLADILLKNAPSLRAGFYKCSSELTQDIEDLKDGNK